MSVVAWGSSSYARKSAGAGKTIGVRSDMLDSADCDVGNDAPNNQVKEYRIAR